MYVVLYEIKSKWIYAVVMVFCSPGNVNIAEHLKVRTLCLDAECIPNLLGLVLPFPHEMLVLAD